MRSNFSRILSKADEYTGHPYSSRDKLRTPWRCNRVQRSLILSHETKSAVGTSIVEHTIAIAMRNAIPSKSKVNPKNRLMARSEEGNHKGKVAGKWEASDG
ncbi:hypothetical protein Pcinc_028038 [Petrolisthes cinctipes]|uniref:Uncharacterized protein n=1 Tax=Petrolisthes cinctipes TaxID=88211 RepID=A0AAE1F3P7_PETCI|nr:hypothetical protein Pcinc_028038 [Petrolisthes cinctipes]